MYYNTLTLVLLTALTPFLHGINVAPCNGTAPECVCFVETDPAYNQCKPPLILTEQAEMLMNALDQASACVMTHPDHSKLFGTFQKLIKLMQQRDGFTGKPLKPGAINLLIKHAARGLGKYLTIFGSYLDAPSAKVVSTLLTNVQHALAHAERYVITKNNEEKALVGQHLGNIAQELARLIDIEASGKPHLEMIQQINRTIPLMIAELRQGIEDTPIKPTVTTQILTAPLAQFLMPEAINLANALYACGQHEWLDAFEEMDETLSDSEAFTFALELLPTIAYQLGTYLTHAQGDIFVQLLQDIHNISTQIEFCIANNDPQAKQLAFANCSKLIQDACMYFKLPVLPVVVLTMLKACNLELPVIVKQFNNGVARAKR